MAIWAIADLHLSFGVPNKEMDIFGEQWKDHPKKIEQAWREVVAPEDLVLIPGDISWALRLDEVEPDLNWIDRLPGTKFMIKGNHDYWWDSISKIKRILPPSCHLIQNNSLMWNDVAIAGSRMWDSAEFNFDRIVERTPVTNNEVKPLTESDYSEEREKIFRREIGRLEMSLRSMDPKAKQRIVMTHYPPISLELKDSEISRLLDKYKVNTCIFGHLHNIKPDPTLFGVHNGIDYHLVACDYLDFVPRKVYE